MIVLANEDQITFPLFPNPCLAIIRRFEVDAMLRHDFPNLRSLFALFHKGTIFVYLGMSELHHFGFIVEHHQHIHYRVLAWVAVRGLLDQRQQCMGRHFELRLGGGTTSVSFWVVRPVPAKAGVSHFGQIQPRFI